MNFKSFITESVDMETINSILKKDCQPFLSEAQGLHLYRGIRNFKSSERVIPGLWKFKVRKDRRPLLGNIEYFNIFNELFEKKFHIPNIRSVSAVCTGDKSLAESYGDTNLIFPIGKFTYTWSIEVKDALLHYDKELTIQAMNSSNKGVESKELKKGVLSKMVDTYEMDDLREAIKSYNEILIQCDYYYAVSELYEGDGLI